MKLYKLMSQNRMTRNDTKWEIGIAVEKTPRENPQLCSADVLHAYKNLNLAFLLNPVHADITNPIVAECEGDIAVEGWGKIGSYALTPLRWINPPEWVGSHYEKQVWVQFAVLCAESVANIYNEQFPNDNRINDAINVAKKYLKKPSGTTAKAAYAAAHSSSDAAYAAAHSSSDAAYAAARVAVNAAYAAARAVAYSSSDAAARVAANAANAFSSTHIDFCELADKAVKMVQEDNDE